MAFSYGFLVLSFSDECDPSPRGSKHKNSAKFKKASILDVLKSIEAQTQLSFVYNNELKALQKRVDFSYQSDSVDSILQKLATEYGVSFLRIHNSISVKVNAPKATADRRPIKGTV